MEKIDKVDKGFELVYNNLSYRRKFIRTLWLIPLSVLIPVFIYISTDSMIISIVLAVVLAVIHTIQAVYNYRKWKE